MNLFKRRQKAQAIEPLDMATSPATAAQKFAEETPDVGLAKARSEFFEAVGGPTVASSRAFVVNIILGVVCVTLGLVIRSLIPLHTVETRVVLVNPVTGEKSVEQSMAPKVAEYVPERAVLDREIFEFVKNLYMINADAPVMVEEAHARGYVFTRERANAEFREFVEKEQTYQRMRTTPGLTRTVVRNTMTKREDANVYLIRYSSLERSRGQTEPIVRNWIMQLSFTKQPPDEKERDLNPLGIFVLHFEIQEER